MLDSPLLDVDDRPADLVVDSAAEDGDAVPQVEWEDGVVEAVRERGLPEVFALGNERVVHEGELRGFICEVAHLVNTDYFAFWEEQQS